jgi:hypothetical protein
MQLPRGICVSPWRLVYQAERENFATDIVALDDHRCASASYSGEIRVHQQA